MSKVLQIPEHVIRHHERGRALARFLRQKRAERRLKRRALRFRSTDEHVNQEAYGAMTPQEFEEINGCQEWANWRVIPRMLTGLVPNRSLFVVDLGCGSGGSTSILATYCPPGSELLGLDASESLIAMARARSFTTACGEPIHATFEAQLVSPPLKRAGRPLRSEQRGPGSLERHPGSPLPCRQCG